MAERVADEAGRGGCRPHHELRNALRSWRRGHRGGGGPENGALQTAELARREKNWTDAVKKGPLMAADRNPCERCGELFTVPRRAPHKRFCTERCQRNAESERYRRRHPEKAWCPRCGEGFERATGTARGRVYCSTRCQYAERSAEYQKREDIRAGIARARALRRPGGDGLERA